MQSPIDPNQRFDDGSTLFMRTCTTGELETLRALIASGADVNAKNNNGITALMAVCLQGSLNVVELLLDNGADAGIVAESGMTALYAACMSENPQIAKFLLEHDAKSNNRTNGNAALRFACFANNPKIIKFLVENGVDVNANDERDPFALMIACDKCSFEIVKLLVEYGANVNALAQQRLSALMIACLYGKYDVAEFLLKNGADKNVVTDLGKTAIDIARENGNSQIVLLLEKYDSLSSLKKEDKQISENTTNKEFSFIGHENIRQELLKFVTKFKIQQKQESLGTKKDLNNTIFLFSGNTGTGKFTVAKWFLEKLKNEKLVSEKNAVFSLKELYSKYQDEYLLKSFLDQNNYSFLIIKEVHLEPGYLNELLRALSENKSGTICICIGLSERLDMYFKENPDSAQRFNFSYRFKNLTDNELTEILENKLKEKGFSYSDEAKKKFPLFVVEMNNDEKRVHENGWLVEKDLITKILQAQAERLSTLKNPTDNEFIFIEAEDVPVIKKKRTKEEILSELDELVGLSDVKTQIRELMTSVEVAKARAEKGLGGEIPKIHIQFIGNPGTGKTTIARMLGELFCAIDLLPSSKVIETDRSKLVGKYVGHTAPLVNEYCDKAMGGILFIDEAYSLNKGDGDTFGQEAVDALLKRMEDDRGKFVVITAGYRKEMAEFIASNSGLESRFTHKIELPDYTPEELFAIFKLYAKKKDYILSVEAEQKLEKVINEMYETRSNTFANARSVRNLFDETIRRQSSRVMQLPQSEQTKNAYAQILPEDIS